MKIAVIGTGYVGLVSATCFAESGNDVIGMDVDALKVASLEAGKVPIYEPGLQELLARNQERAPALHHPAGGTQLEPSSIIFLAVGTPQAERAPPT